VVGLGEGVGNGGGWDDGEVGWEGGKRAWLRTAHQVGRVLLRASGISDGWGRLLVKKRRGWDKGVWLG
jgi:hypothetical protein